MAVEDLEVMLKELKIKFENLSDLLLLELKQREDYIRSREARNRFISAEHQLEQLKESSSPSKNNSLSVKELKKWANRKPAEEKLPGKARGRDEYNFSKLDS